MDARAQNITALSLPFAAGAAAGILLSGCGASVYGLAPVSFLLTALAGVLLATGRLRSLPAVLGMVFCAGLCCGLLGSLTAPGRHVATMGRVRDLIAAIPYPSASTGGLVQALTTGDRSLLSPETVAAFRQSGASHILALSGLHLGIIYLMLSGLTSVFGHSRPARSLRYAFLVGLSGLYAVATGASPSIVRAFLFILLGETARLLGRRVRPLSVFCGALTLQLVLDPTVIRSVGFQLSYLAMAGIFLVFPVLRAWYPASSAPGAPSRGARPRLTDRLDLPRRIWEAAALAISCQLLTAPLAWLRFGTFPRYFLLTNLLAMPLTTVVMVLSVATVLLSALGFCPAFLIVWNDVAVQTLLRLLELIASL